MHPPSRVDFEPLERRHRQLAVQAHVLGVLKNEIHNHLEPADRFAVFMADSAIVEGYQNPMACLAWLTDNLRQWLRVNESFSASARRSVVQRYIPLPYPSLLTNWHDRATLIKVILMNLHMQLWHGVVCEVAFVDPRNSKSSAMIPNLNYVALPSHQAFLDTPAFHHGESLKTAKLAGVRANDRFSAVLNQKRQCCREPIWLWYDEAHFSARRLSGLRWEQLRKFFHLLLGPEIECAGCRKRTREFELDHIAPNEGGFYQTIINFEPLCPSCNARKGAKRGRNPFIVDLLLPPELHSKELDDFYRLKPPWLGNLEMPSTLRQIERKLEGL